MNERKLGLITVNLAGFFTTKWLRLCDPQLSHQAIQRYDKYINITYVHRLRLSAHTAAKICTVVILGLETAESLQLR